MEQSRKVSSGGVRRTKYLQMHKAFRVYMHTTCTRAREPVRICMKMLFPHPCPKAKKRKKGKKEEKRGKKSLTTYTNQSQTQNQHKAEVAEPTSTMDATAQESTMDTTTQARPKNMATISSIPDPILPQRQSQFLTLYLPYILLDRGPMLFSKYRSEIVLNVKEPFQLPFVFVFLKLKQPYNSCSARGVQIRPWF